MARRRRTSRLAIPRRIVVRGKAWSVRLTGPRKRAEMRGLRGLCDPERRTIWIDSKVSAMDQGVTLIHEIIHAALDGRGIPIQWEEAAAYGLEEALHSLVLSGSLVAVPEEVR